MHQINMIIEQEPPLPNIHIIVYYCHNIWSDYGLYVNTPAYL